MDARNTDISSYLSEEDLLETARTVDDSIYESENVYEDDEAPASSVIKVGWGEARKAQAKATKTYANDFKFDEEVQLIKFLSPDPMSFSQHWVQRTGKKSFVCLGTSDCPLCRAGNKADSKFAFSVVNLSEDEPAVQVMVVGLRLCGQIEKLNNDPKTGPIDRMFWAVSKSGQGTKTTYSIMMVKDRDLSDDWDLELQDVTKTLLGLTPLGPDAIRVSTKAELAEIARELPED